MLTVVREAMLREVKAGRFLVVDRDDGMWEKERKLRLVNAGVLNTHTTRPGW